ncbi:MAG: hypothetical protein F4112_01390 [Holophagales bacterium]|nr:hypothetical protein [Holophagales bacterium]MYD22675.1 hypothetical protein [Holophagales bacterium]MYI31602.1 hypothetical protein [Holophagales bacterium]
MPASGFCTARSTLTWLTTSLLLHTALWGGAAEAQEIPAIDVMVVAPEGFESDVSAARLISDASKIYESNGLLSLRFAGLVRLPPIPEVLSGDLGEILSGRTPALREVRQDVERERLCRRADLVLIWVSTSDSPHVAGRGFLFHGRDFGYSIVATSSGRRRVNLPRAVAHEIGHNLGLRHEMGEEGTVMSYAGHHEGLSVRRRGRWEHGVQTFSNESLGQARMTAWTVSSYDGPGGVFRNRPGKCSG